jgi:hypothetical protein
MKNLPFKLRGIPLSSSKIFQEKDLLTKVDSDCAGAFHTDLYEDLDIVIGTAYHSILFAVQAEVPVIAINYAPKVRRFMQDVGLEEFVLELDEWDRLSAKVSVVLRDKNSIKADLAKIREELHVQSLADLSTARFAIEKIDAVKFEHDALVSIIVLDNDVRNSLLEETLNSCFQQTYLNIELIVVTSRAGQFSIESNHNRKVTYIQTDEAASEGERINEALGQVSGAYVSWIRSGDRYADDAIDYLLNILECHREIDLVYSEYFEYHDRGVLGDPQKVYQPNRLIRRNVIGPSFLSHGYVFEYAGPLSSDLGLPEYEYWLRIKELFKLKPVHVKLFYRFAENAREDEEDLELEVRRNWRRDKRFIERSLWYAVDLPLVRRDAIPFIMKLYRYIRRSPVN